MKSQVKSEVQTQPLGFMLISISNVGYQFDLFSNDTLTLVLN